MKVTPIWTLKKVGLVQDFQLQVHSDHVAGMHSVHFVWLLWGNKHPLEMHPSLGVLTAIHNTPWSLSEHFPKDRELRSPALRRWALRGEGHLRVGWPWWVHAVLGVAPAESSRSQSREVQEYRCKLYSLFISFPDSWACALEKIKLVSLSPFSTSLGPGWCSTELGSDLAVSFSHYTFT